MSAAPDTTAAEARRATTRSMTIGAVCKALSPEFPDISISKIRYLEDQKLLTPRRTQGGYRLYTQADVQRLVADFSSPKPWETGRAGTRGGTAGVPAPCMSWCGCCTRSSRRLPPSGRSTSA